MHGMDTSDPNAPKVVHVFMPRDTKGASIVETWDVLGMRATKSEDTVLKDVFVPDRLVARIVPAGPARLDDFVLNIFAWALMGFGNIYYGLARKAFDVIVGTVKNKTSIGLSRPMAYHAEVQHAVAEMAMALEGIEPHLDPVAEEWSSGRDWGRSGPRRSLPRSSERWKRAGKSLIWRWMWLAGSAFSARAGSSVCSVMPGSAACIRQTRC